MGVKIIDYGNHSFAGFIWVSTLVESTNTMKLNHKLTKRSIRKNFVFKC